jgi:hypothetical protein
VPPTAPRSPPPGWWSARWGTWRRTGTVDARSDVYSLACVLYETLTGKPPYGEGDPAQQMHAHLTSEPPRASRAARDVPAALDAVIARGMAKEPDARYSSAGNFAAAASATLARSAPALPPPPVTRPTAPAGHPATRMLTAVTPTPPTAEVRSAAPAGQRDHRLRRWIPFAAGAALVAAVGLWLLGSGIDFGSAPVAGPTTSEAATSTDASLPSTGGQAANPGPAVRDGNFAFTVTGVASEATTAADSHTIVTLTVTNVSDREQTLVVADQRLVTTGGRSVPPDAAVTAELNTPGGSARLAPGRVSTIRLAFDLPGKNKNGKKNDKKDDVASHLILHGAPSSPGVTVPIG